MARSTISPAGRLFVGDQLGELWVINARNGYTHAQCRPGHDRRWRLQPTNPPGRTGTAATCTANGGSFGIPDSVIMDSAGGSQRIFAFSGNDGTAGASAVVAQLKFDLTGLVRVHVGLGSVGTTIANWNIHTGAFDDAYFGATPSSGHLFLCGTGAANTQPTHYWIGFAGYPTNIFDASAFPFLAELSTQVAALSSQLGRQIHVIAESDLNDIRVLRPVEVGGFGMHAQWSDDFHHSVHTLLTGESSGYYADFGGSHPLKKTLENGWYYSGQYSRHRERRHGNCSQGFAPGRFVVCSQNHDQVGNRAKGERLSTLVDFEGLKLAAGITMLSSFVPMLFMGEEYGEVAPFLYFTSHGDKDLGEAVRRGRENEFSSFGWQGGIPDPQAESTFSASRLDHSLAEREPHRTLQNFYKKLLRYRRERKLAKAKNRIVSDFPDQRCVLVRFETGEISLAAAFHFGQMPAKLPLALPNGKWTVAIDSADQEWGGKGSPYAGKPIRGRGCDGNDFATTIVRRS